MTSSIFADNGMRDKPILAAPDACDGQRATAAFPRTGLSL